MSMIKSLLRTPVRALVKLVRRVLTVDGSVLLISRGAGAKDAEVVSRAERVLARPFDRALVRRTGVPSIWSIVRASTVIEVDEGLIPASYRKVFLHIFGLDFERNAYDGWELARLGSRLIPGPDPLVLRHESQQRLLARVAALEARGARCVYAFGTGPSLAQAGEHSFTDGTVIVCNTIVRDPALWAHLNAEFIVAGDAIYHFGFSEHALAFRRDLLSRLIEGGTRPLFVYPELFDRIVRREFHAVEHLLVPIPIGLHTDIAVDLRTRFELPALGNVLNGLLLPLGCTLSKTVRLWGFDGRAPDDKLFWSNSKLHAYPELMPGLIEAHPAFYETLVPKGKESSYVMSVHGDDLHRRLTAAELNGFRFEMLHHSWTETLNRRRVEAK